MKAIKILSIAGLLLISLNSMSAVHVITQSGMTFSPSTLTVNVGDVVRWEWSNGTHTTSSRTIPATAATWDAPLTSTSTSFEYTVMVAGTFSYACNYHESMGMTGTFTAVAVSTGINENGLSQTISVYPNPAKSFINLKTSLSGDIVIYDILGNSISSYKLNDLPSSDESYKLDLTDLSKGIYIISIIPTNEKKRVSLRFIKD